MKLKGLSYYSKSSLTDNIPLAPALYDSDDSVNAHLILEGESGGLVAGSSISLTGLNTNAKPNENGWLLTGYTSSFSMTPAVFKSYTTARKEYQSITTLDDVNSDGIYLWTGSDPLVIDDTNKSNFNSRKVVLITTGTVTVSATTLSPTSGSLAVVAPTINFSGTTVQADGVYIADTITTGTASNQGLKIVGNLVAQSSFTNNRQWSNLNRPSVFVVFDQQKYMHRPPKSWRLRKSALTRAV
ncbi:MAG: hypothetical protein DCC56_00310 [Anaerolineae bacterium]|nr:MAG: hypothetical protein DCC56_00310 [Anaerolineae bacterium]WKZ44474.1 MAG: hypothetical protein QY302_01625 [Anaerolineales bacterium]